MAPMVQGMLGYGGILEGVCTFRRKLEWAAARCVGGRYCPSCPLGYETDQNDTLLYLGQTVYILYTNITH